MEIFETARTVRLKGHHGKYLWAEEDLYKISQKRESKNEQALWRLEKVPDGNLIRFVSCFDTYLTASDDLFLLGMTGKKAVQTKPKHIDSSVEWEPVSEGSLVKLKTCHGNYLRANTGVPPWRDSVTHDLPQRIQKHLEYLLWEVEVVSVPNVIPIEEKPELQPLLSSGRREPQHHWYTPLSTGVPQSKPDEGRQIFYTVADDENGEAKGVDGSDWPSFMFKGHSLKRLKEHLQKETGIAQDIMLCARQPKSAKLYTLRLGLPPNHASMHIVVVRENSPFARTFSIQPKEDNGA